jgi:TRAP-type mannitol/chloroaromatic compound transport system permease large subunit
MVPPLFLIFLVLGTIFVGLATPTQGGPSCPRLGSNAA